MTAILVSFSYDNTLSSGKNDLDLVSDYCSTIGLQVFVMTDFEVTEKKRIFSIDNLKEDLETTRVVLYYSGHAKENYLQFPCGDVCMKTFYMSVVSRFPKAQIVSIFDCCCSSSFSLAYTIQQESHVLSYNPLYSHNEIIHFSSSMREETALSTEVSCFTKSLIRVLKTHESRLHRLVEELKTSVRSQRYDIDTLSQIPQIFTSFSSIVRMWPWFYGINIDIIGDYFIVNELRKVSRVGI